MRRRSPERGLWGRHRVAEVLERLGVERDDVVARRVDDEDGAVAARHALRGVELCGAVASLARADELELGERVAQQLAVAHADGRDDVSAVRVSVEADRLRLAHLTRVGLLGRLGAHARQDAAHGAVEAHHAQPEVARVDEAQ